MRPDPRAVQSGRGSRVAGQEGAYGHQRREDALGPRQGGEGKVQGEEGRIPIHRIKVY